MSRLLTYLAAVHARGLRVAEHPAYGGVTKGAHTSSSYHYKGRAADLNFGAPGTPPEERPVLLWAARLADAAGLNVIYTPHRVHPIAKTAAAHRDHLHVDDGPIQAYKAPGRDDALYARILSERPTTTQEVTVNVTIGKVRKGDTGPDVRLLQGVLNVHGAGVAAGVGVLALDDDFGDKTDKALRAHQTAHKIDVDGVAGADSWRTLLEDVPA
ncbi:Peptidoglycan-binding domain 1 protein [Xylanimonas cellulosilytica DSM 15894]|uniref:Peptidoglycan-binding domain 1 protein n=1 Tax=Xylanimonas cellulosilytica (strain DSM 15894 / JCM 12276 / CECT 5975 / KCTC 9989 / LMG 20990 / NBRC 107835 / XIL07) TaxID=446471 RepID=D1BW53_XYLCX|nr:peptidoglycan-binding domain-containing protein [Xylanimonas cellulosilytica]ACZ29556.1 Peptidoglycan-binding domain 1 protein [Xylanimonas cellulosilytica DSM 15894]